MNAILEFPTLPAVADIPLSAVPATIDLKALALTRFGDWRPQAAALVAKYKGVAFDCKTTKGMAEATAERALTEGATADATDRETPANTSPRGGAMGAGQAAAAAPVGAPEPQQDAPTLVLGDINSRLGFIVTADFIFGLGFKRQVRIGRGVHFLLSDWPAIKAALVKHIEALA